MRLQTKMANYKLMGANSYKLEGNKAKELG